MQPIQIDPEKVRNSMAQAKDKQKQYYDRTAKALPPLNLNKYVRVQIGKTWKPAKVIKINDEHSFIVQTKDGGIYRRNRRLLIKTPEKIQEIADFTPDFCCNQIAPTPLRNPLPLNRMFHRIRTASLKVMNKRHDLAEGLYLTGNIIIVMYG